MKRNVRSLLAAFFIGAAVVAATLVTCHATRTVASSLASIAQEFAYTVQAYFAKRDAR